jgi:hypothetical protein
MNNITKIHNDFFIATNIQNKQYIPKATSFRPKVKSPINKQLAAIA